MLEQSKSAVRAAVLSGKRGLRMDVLIPQYDASSRGFDRAGLFDMCAGIAMQLGFVGDGPRLLVFQAKAQTCAIVYANAHAFICESAHACESSCAFVPACV
jgi:hypothetical protein